MGIRVLNPNKIQQELETLIPLGSFENPIRNFMLR